MRKREDPIITSDRCAGPQYRVRPTFGFCLLRPGKGAGLWRLTVSQITINNIQFDIYWASKDLLLLYEACQRIPELNEKGGD